MKNQLDISNNDLDALVEKSRTAQRGRVAMPLTDKNYKGFQILYNAIQPASYVQPHRHQAEEVWMPIRGSIALVTFDKQGKLHEKFILSRERTNYHLVNGGIWHSCFALEPDSIFCNISPGPFNLNQKEFATWAPTEDLRNPKENKVYLGNLRSLF
ncbi:MAG: WbuC family cupin fold metalloprotein [Nanoarchaeota archaeon]